MNSPSALITGVVLAGGQGRRMGGVDKGLLPWRGEPLVCHALEALRGVAATLLINANRNSALYRDFGYRVIPDLNEGFAGPLAGLLSAMRATATPYVLTVPCDTPLLTTEVLARLVERLGETNASIAVAHDGEHPHPVVMLAATRLADDLEAYLASGERRVESWIRRHAWVAADCSDHPEALANINTREELDRLERQEGFRV